MVVGIGDRNRERGAEADPVFGTFDAVIDVHGCLQLGESIGLISQL
jgi:hypothetical protein